jgi:hypothetical protein
LRSLRDFASELHHPNVLSLARAAEEARVDLRVVVLHREPARMITSLSKRFRPRGDVKEPPAFQALQMANQAALLNAQLGRVDDAFFTCVGFNDTRRDAARVADFLFSGLRRAPDRALDLGASLRNIFRLEHDGDTAAVLQNLAHMTYSTQKREPATADAAKSAITTRVAELYAYWTELKERHCARPRTHRPR